MKHSIMISALIILFGTFLWANEVRSYDFNQSWAEMDSLRQAMLPLSMAEKANEIYDAAVAEDLPAQQVKALIHWIGSYVYKDDDDVQKIVDNIQARIDGAEGVAKPLLHAVMAQTLSKYLNSNLWRFSQRGEFSQENTGDISTWDIPSLIREISRHYELALEPADLLLAQSMDDYPELKKGNYSIPGNSVFDFVGKLALAFYSYSYTRVASTDSFDPGSEQNFYPLQQFLQLNPPEPQALSINYQAFKLFQTVLRQHAAGQNPVARVRWDLQRLEYFYKMAPWESTYPIYEAALLALESKNTGHAADWIYRDLITLHYELGLKYKPEVSEEYRWHFKIAMEYYNKVTPHPKRDRHIQFSHVMTIRSPQLELLAESILEPNTPALARVRVRNTTKLYVKIFNVDHPDKHSTELKLPPKEKSSSYRFLVKEKPLVQEVYHLPSHGDYRDHFYEIALPPLPAGSYVLSADDGPQDSWRKYPDWGDTRFTVTDIGYIMDNQHPGRLYLKSRSTGAALESIEVRAYWAKKDAEGRDYNEQYLVTHSGKDGIVEFSIEDLKKHHTTVSLSDGKDKIFVDGRVFYDGKHHSRSDWDEIRKEQEKHISLLFSDRAIYRPGQNIHVKGLFAVQETNGEALPKVNSRVQIRLSDYQGRGFAHKDLVTDEYGTVHWTFKIPEDLRPGKVHINVSEGQLIVHVEEYKRPRFEVKLEKPEQGYKLNSEVSINGSAKAYAGFPIENAQLRYRIYREARYPFWRWWWGNKPEHAALEISTGTATTDMDGKFSISFKAIGDASAVTKYQPFFVYTILVDVTDQSGESRSGSLSLKIGTRELILDAEIAEYIEQGTPEIQIPISALNLSSEKLPVQGSINILRLKTPQHIMRKRLWSAPEGSLVKEKELFTPTPHIRLKVQKPIISQPHRSATDATQINKEVYHKLFPHDAYLNEDDKSTWEELETVFKDSFDTGTQDFTLINSFSKLQAGCYKLILKGQYKGQETLMEKYFEIVDAKAETPGYPQALYLAPLKVDVQPSEKAKVLIGSSYQDFHLYYEIERHQEIIHSETIVLNNQQLVLEIPIKEQDRGGLHLTFTGVKDGRFYSLSQEITVPWSNKELKLEVLTKPDQLQPGAEEEWQIMVRDYRGKPVRAQILASMYDASLDTFSKSFWVSMIHRNVPRKKTWKGIGLDRLWRFSLGYYNDQRYHDAYRNFGAWMNWYNFRLFYASVWVPWDGVHRDYLMAMRDMGGMGQNAAKTLDPDAIPVRSNFAETAFFYPDLITDAHGLSSFSFKVPDSLTRWKFRALALTEDHQIGYIEFELPAQKPLMLSPNLPRFLREGDEFVFTVKITSLQDEALQGSCKLMLLDAESGEPLDQAFALASPLQSFSLPGSASTLLQWKLQIPEGRSLVKYRVLASSGSFSDAEEGMLPILSNRMLLTETLPLPMRGRSKKSFSLDKLRHSTDSKTLSQHSLTLEYTANPLWYAVQSLPYLMDYPYKCSEQIFSRYYANALARQIIKENPEIRSTLESWRRIPDTPVLQANLDKNPELKSIALEETPWIFSALRESDRRKRLAIHLDTLRVDRELSQALAELSQAQYPSGAWPWFPGLEESRYITQYIVSGFAQLQKLGIDYMEDQALTSMLNKAIYYLDERYVQDYKTMEEKDTLKHYMISPSCAHYLYTRSFFADFPMEEETKAVHDFYVAKAKAGWNSMPIYVQGLIALGMHQSGETGTADGIVASLRQRATRDAKLGMWWHESRSWYWYHAPIETQSLMIEVFTEIAQDTATVDELRLWLLKHKQTNSWSTTTATARACYALLMSGSEWLSSKKPVEITLGKHAVDTASGEPGTGYFKQVWQADEVLPDMGEVKVQNPNPVPAWGALYWQYFEDLDQITAAQSPLSLNKALYRQIPSPASPALEAIADGTTLKTGDKIISRIVLKTDRDMEFVHMKDMRGSGLEPVNVFSQSKWQDGLRYYELTKDAATHFFFDYLPAGTYVFEYPLWVNNQGDFSLGICTIQSMYAPEFAAHSEGIRIKVSE